MSAIRVLPLIAQFQRSDAWVLERVAVWQYDAMRSSTPFPLLRTYLSSVRRKLRFVLLNALNLVSIALTVLGFSTQNLVLEVVSIGGLLIGVAGVYMTARKSYQDIEDLYVEYLPPLSLRQVRSISIPPRLLDSGYELLPRRGTPSDALLTSRRVNRCLFAGADSGLRIRKAHFRASHPAETAHVLLREFTQKKSVALFNGHKIRLASDLLFDGHDAFMATEIQPTRYFETMVTNDSLRVRVMSRKAHSAVFTGDSFCYPGNTVPACKQSLCANQLGASTLAVTLDDYLVLVEQGRRSNVAKSKLSPSGSGSADWKDVGRSTNLQQLVRAFAVRELVEECGLAADDVAWIRILGYGRFVLRGGLPQFFCLARLTCNYDKIQVTRSERGLTDHHRPVDIHEGKYSRYQGIQMAVQKIRKEEDYMTGSSLWWNLELLSQVPESDIENIFR